MSRARTPRLRKRNPAHFGVIFGGNHNLEGCRQRAIPPRTISA